MHYVITAELDAKPTEETTDWAVEELAHWHAVAHTHPSGHLAVTMTLPAESLTQAVATAVKLLETTHRVITLEVADEETRDARLGWVSMPRLIGATEAASVLGISREAVGKRIRSGALPAQRVGREWAIPASALLPDVEDVADTSE